MPSVKKDGLSPIVEPYLMLAHSEVDRGRKKMSSLLRSPALSMYDQ